jgi:hypothetical protein
MLVAEGVTDIVGVLFDCVTVIADVAPVALV